MKTVSRALIVVLALALCACGSNVTKTDRTYGNWQVMTFTPKKGPMLCYAGTTPKESKSTVAKRDTLYLMITRRASGKIEISASSGYSFRKGSNVELVIDGKKSHSLFFKDNVAWATSDEEDKLIVAELKKAKTIKVHGLAKDKGRSTDTYSGKGFTAALARVRELCP